MTTRVAFRSAMRSAAVTMLNAYATSAGIPLQVYRGRPRTLYPPTAFVDAINEPTIAYSAGLRQRTPQAEVIVVHGLFDSGEAVDQVDAFMDAFLDYVTDNPAAAGAATLVEVTATDDIPDYVPSWLPENQQLAYYATRITLEGLVLDGRVN